MCSILANHSDEYKIKCFDHESYKKTDLIDSFIRNNSGYLIVLDDADLILDDNSRKLISLDENNTFLILGTDITGLFINAQKLKRISFENNTLSLKSYFDRE